MRLPSCRLLLIALLWIPLFVSRSQAADRKPNFIVVFVDDMGYGDLGCFGSTVHRTPNLDQMAADGTMMMDFYSSCSVCTPSRASLMTGCYPRRVSMHQDTEGYCVLFPKARKGLNPDEVTIAELLKKQGYATMCIGKWHLGDHPDFLPTKQGFDRYFGIPYSNDMGATQRDINRKSRGNPPLPLLRGDKVVEAPVHQESITYRYTVEAVNFIRDNKDKPFFLYLPHTAVHGPLFPGKEFKGKSQDGLYGDWVEEVDWSMGRIFEQLEIYDLDEDTLVLFTTDNGSAREKQGSNLPLRGRKGRTDEGGMRVPCIAKWTGKIPAGKRCTKVAATIDLLPTFAKLAGTRPALGRKIDGKDIWPLLSGRPTARSPHKAYFYYQMDQLQAVRSGDWKLFVPMDSKKRNWGDPEGPTELQLFNLKRDIHEDKNVAAQNPSVVRELLSYAQEAREELGDVDRPGKGQRPAGLVAKGRPLVQ